MKNISLYIHIPFCEQKYYYCDFSSFIGKDSLKGQYIDALNKEIDDKNLNKYFIDTIFIGGGTPSLLEAEELEIIFKKINELNLSDNLEFTIECTPGSITKEKLDIMKKYGVNRLSIKLQAIQNTLFRDIGRNYSYEVFKEEFNLARECGFNNINVDLMFALPGQKLNDWKESLELISSLKPEHISTYSLIIEEGTVLDKLYEQGKVELPNEEIKREMYYMAKEILESSGMKQYEISNYSRENLESRHNIAYWEMKEWIGVGSAASSHINGRRITNILEVEDYISRIFKNEPVEVENHINTQNENIEEFMFMGLGKIDGISEEEFKNRFNKSIDEIYEDIISKYIKEGLIIREDRRIKLTVKGIEYSNIIMADFLLEI